MWDGGIGTTLTPVSNLVSVVSTDGKLLVACLRQQPLGLVTLWGAAGLAVSGRLGGVEHHQRPGCREPHRRYHRRRRPLFQPPQRRLAHFSPINEQAPAASQCQGRRCRELQAIQPAFVTLRHNVGFHVPRCRFCCRSQDGEELPLWIGSAAAGWPVA